MKNGIIGLILICFLLLPQQVMADYVLPYPSFMPGNKVYRITRVIDELKRFWYFGTIARIKYHLGLSDKYLVEAKTLFEYKQYLLAADALTRSDRQLTGLPVLLTAGDSEKKDMSPLRLLVTESMSAHAGVLTALKDQLPPEFIWQPEKSAPTTLPIAGMLANSLQIRRDIVTEVTAAARLPLPGR